MASLRIAGRPLEAADLELIHSIIAERSDWSRWALSRELARRFSWYSPSGQLKDMACRTLLVKLDQAGLAPIPAPKQASPSPRVQRVPDPVEHDTDVIAEDLSVLRPLRLTVVAQKTAEDHLIRHLLHSYHYLGFKRTGGATLRYLLHAADGRLVGCALWGSAAWMTAPRDRWIGWNQETRRDRLAGVVNNTRYLIFPWVRVPHLASHGLGLMARHIRKDWWGCYRHEVALAETFVDFSRHSGTCYRAAGWHCVGETTGRSRNEPGQRPVVARKGVFLKPLMPQWRQILGGEG